MDVLQKGGLTVVVATVIASAMILLTGKSVIAKDQSEKTPVKVLKQGAKNSKTDLNSALPLSVTAASKAESHEVTVDRVPPTGDSVVSEDEVIPPPPPGLFVISAPVEVLSKKNSFLGGADNSQNSFVRMKPSMDFTASPSPQAPAMPSQPQVELLKPSIKKPKMIEPIIPKMPQQINRLQQQPTLMQKKPKIDVNIHQPKLQNNERVGVDPSQRYMLIPAPVYFPSYGYPQMPVIGAGGHYYAPVPQHLTPLNTISAPTQESASKKGNNK